MAINKNTMMEKINKMTKTYDFNKIKMPTVKMIMMNKMNKRTKMTMEKMIVAITMMSQMLILVITHV